MFIVQGVLQEGLLLQTPQTLPQRNKGDIDGDIVSSAMSTAEPDEEWGRVLEGMKKDSAYITITADEVIKVIGRDISEALHNYAQAQRSSEGHC